MLYKYVCTLCVPYAGLNSAVAAPEPSTPDARIQSQASPMRNAQTSEEHRKVESGDTHGKKSDVAS